MAQQLREVGRRWLKTPLTVAVRRSLAVRESGRFVWRERRGATGADHAYRLRRDPVRVVVRHRSRDMEVFHELVVARRYDTPPVAGAALQDLRAPRVVDLGANIGLFGVRALALWPEASIVAVEADPANAAVLRSCVALNEAADRWHVIEAFAATETGTVRFRAGDESYSRRAWGSEHEGVIEVPQVDALELLAGADLFKIDIEGSEWPILADPRWAELRPRGVILEYHGQPGIDTFALAREALDACGLEHIALHRDDALGLGLLWGWRG